MIKKWFDWTARDIAAWEKIRARGLVRFVLWYGVCITGGGLFLLLGLLSLLLWLKDSLLNRIATVPTPVYLLLQSAFLAALALVGGLVNSLVTWMMEETIYRRIYRPKQTAPPGNDLPANPRQ